MIKKGFVGKVTNVAELMPFRHRTNIRKFLTKSPWNEDEYVDLTGEILEREPEYWTYYGLSSYTVIGEEIQKC